MLVIMQTRIFALYSSRRLAIINAVMFTLEITLMVVLLLFAPLTCNASFRGGFTFMLGDSQGRCDKLPIYWVPSKCRFLISVGHPHLKLSCLSQGLAFELWLAGLAFAKLRPKVLKHDMLTVIVTDR